MAHGITVHLMRHEKTEANIQGKYIGWTDEPILGKVAAQLPFDAHKVYGSDLIRCRQTAACYFPNAEFSTSANLREIHFGDFEMCTYEQLQHHAAYRAWIDDPVHASVTNGESFTAFLQRVVGEFHRIVNDEGTYTFIVHGGVIRLLLAMYGMNEQTFMQTMADHRTVYTLYWRSLEELKGGARCTLYSEAPIMVSEPLQES